MGSYALDNGVNGGNAGQAAATGVVPVYNGFGNFGPYVYNHPGAFAVQSGYEGYLVPGPESQSLATLDTDEGFNPFSGVSNIFPSARTVLSTVGRALGVVFGLLGVTVVGGGLSTAICTFTPLCSILGLPFKLTRTGSDVVDTTNLPTDLSRAENLSTLASFVRSSIEKFQQMQDPVSNEAAPTIEAESNKIEE